VKRTMKIKENERGEDGKRKKKPSLFKGIK
jgi:hypothetical protein